MTEYLLLFRNASAEDGYLATTQDMGRGYAQMAIMDWQYCHAGYWFTLHPFATMLQ